MKTFSKSKADDAVELVFDDIMDRTPNAALWLHADREGEACIYVTKGNDLRRGTLQRALVAGMLDDEELLEDFMVACARAMTIRAKENGGALPWAPDLFPDE